MRLHDKCCSSAGTTQLRFFARQADCVGRGQATGHCPYEACLERVCHLWGSHDLPVPYHDPGPPRFQERQRRHRLHPEAPGGIEHSQDGPYQISTPHHPSYIPSRPPSYHVVLVIQASQPFASNTPWVALQDHTDGMLFSIEPAAGQAPTIVHAAVDCCCLICDCPPKESVTLVIGKSTTCFLLTLLTPLLVLGCRWPESCKGLQNVLPSVQTRPKHPWPSQDRVGVRILHSQQVSDWEPSCWQPWQRFLDLRVSKH